jgi:hypothetical protein
VGSFTLNGRTPRCWRCRCGAPIYGKSCPCCRVQPCALDCVVCGQVGRFDSDLLMMRQGPTHDRCRGQVDVWSSCVHPGMRQENKPKEVRDGR